MAKQTVPDLKDIFRQAAEIAAQVPESMQEAAFNRALDLLTGEPTTETAPTTRPRSPKSKPKSTKSAPSGADAAAAGSAATLIEQIDSTQHPGVRAASKVLDRALMVLQIALSEHEIDGLAPAEIARILTDKFRIGTSDAAVRMALGNATNLVNRVPRGRGFVYRIMGPGDDYLAHLASAPAKEE